MRMDKNETHLRRGERNVSHSTKLAKPESSDPRRSQNGKLRSLIAIKPLLRVVEELTSTDSAFFSLRNVQNCFGGRFLSPQVRNCRFLTHAVPPNISKVAEIAFSLVGYKASS